MYHDTQLKLRNWYLDLVYGFFGISNGSTKGGNWLFWIIKVSTNKMIVFLNNAFGLFGYLSLQILLLL